MSLPERSWSGYLAALILGCQTPAPSPPEALPATESDGSCLAETLPILAHVVERPISQLTASDAEGLESMRLGDGDFFLYGSVWSPDGRSIALRRKPYSMNEIVPSELVLLAPDTQQDAVLTVDDIPTVDGVVKRYTDGPTWSPDGRELAFASLEGSSHWRVWVIARTGGQRRLLLPELELSHFYPSWSPVPEVSQLAYVSQSEDGAEELWLVELDSGSPPRSLTQRSFTRIEAPRWSPDGTRIAIAATRRTAADPSVAEGEIYVLDVGTSTVTRLGHDFASAVQPVWSPDATSLLVTSMRGGGDAGSGQGDLWQIPLSGVTGPRRLLSSGSPIFGSDWYPLANCSNATRPETR